MGNPREINLLVSYDFTPTYFSVQILMINFISFKAYFWLFLKLIEDAIVHHSKSNLLCVFIN